MKLTFEGQSIREIFEIMERTLNGVNYWRLPPAKPAPASEPVPVVTAATFEPAKQPALVDALPGEKPKRERTEKQLANDEKLRVAALERIAAKKAAKADIRAGIVPPVRPTPTPVPAPPPPPPSSMLSPEEIVRIRLETTKELQAAYANGHQKEVMELLSRFGDGAKSFREVPPEAFVSIREAVDLGALESEAPK